MLPDTQVCNLAVIGLGYVGLPLAIAFSSTKKCKYTGTILNRNIIGFDISKTRINELKKGVDRTNEVNQKELIKT